MFRDGGCHKDGIRFVPDRSLSFVSDLRAALHKDGETSKAPLLSDALDFKAPGCPGALGCFKRPYLRPINSEPQPGQHRRRRSAS